MSTQLRILRLFNLAFGTLAMLAVALLSAFITMRLAIHGREVDVPSFSGLSVPDAQKRARSKGLSLNIENRFYSTSIPAGHLISQSPSPGETVRRDSEVRVTESLGSQQVQIPNTIGQSERSATIAIKRLTLELGTVSYLPTDGPPDTVLAQSPPPNATNVDGPRVSLLISQPPDAASPDTFVMPNLTGTSFAVASFRAAAAGLHIIRTPDPVAVAAANPDGSASPATASGAYQDAVPVTPTFTYPTGNVVAQFPLAGHKVTRGDGVHLAFSHPTPTVDATPATPTPAP
ncbi:PASTA domain, binds beta-lactams [Granulicella pectinivorans]|jgi:beta-lactam-binding protein with PASTA domain|uniref:PASTA domain, binds beta-lactams n=1 Tax=Granulicella pectinivorans TaxID=474950 RepID=A0A1I6MPI2_9BACT|nr:PASTA domain-containing protein [Granulicella pectinivorans]SFS17488.1 PASTA domain, binds beta-lactams [Granulicella pectinivorans]